jgi:hypothetical protein
MSRGLVGGRDGGILEGGFVGCWGGEAVELPCLNPCSRSQDDAMAWPIDSQPRSTAATDTVHISAAGPQQATVEACGVTCRR